MILENQRLEIPNVISFRAKMSINDFNNRVIEFQNYIRDNNLQETGYRFSSVYSLEGEYIDMEVFVSVDRKINVPDIYNFNENFVLENALKYKVIGNPNNNQEKFNELKKYIDENGFIQKSPVYTVTITDLTKIRTIQELENVEVDIYVEVEKV